MDGLGSMGYPVGIMQAPDHAEFIDFHYRLRLDRSTRGTQLSIEFVVKYPNRPKVKGAPLVSEIFFNQRVFIARSDGM
jgi:hypothetical protein